MCGSIFTGMGNGQRWFGVLSISLNITRVVRRESVKQNTYKMERLLIAAEDRELLLNKRHDLSNIFPRNRQNPSSNNTPIN